MRGHIRWGGFGALVIIVVLLIAKILTNPDDLFQASPRETLDRDVSLWLNNEVYPQLEVRRRMYDACLVKWQYNQIVNGDKDKAGLIPDETMEDCHLKAVALTQYRDFDGWRAETDLSLLPPSKVDDI